MRLVLLAIVSACLAFAPSARAAPPAVDWTVKPESARVLPPSSRFDPKQIYVPPYTVHEPSNGAVVLRIVRYRSPWSELYEPAGFREDDYAFELVLKKALPQPYVIQLAGVGLQRLYDSKRDKESESRRDKPLNLHLPTPDEQKFMVKLSWHY